MIRKYIFHAWGLLLLASLVFFGASCKSTPKTDGTADPSAPVSQALLNNLKAARDKAAKARQDSIDVNGQVFFADEWNATEAKYNGTGNNLNEKNVDSVNKAVTAYNECAASFADIAGRSLPLYAESLLAAIAEARQQALDAGAYLYSPERFDPADEKAGIAAKLYDSSDYKGTVVAAKVAIDYYSALKTGADAYTLRLAIVDNDYVHHDPQNFELADVKGQDGLDAYDSGNINIALDSAQEAYLRYKLVWNAAWRTMAVGFKESASEERENALLVKANVAVKDEFAEAEDFYNKANKLYQDEEFADSAGLYKRAGAMFSSAAGTARHKRLMAENAIEEANKRIAESEETALAAEEIIQGGSQ